MLKKLLILAFLFLTACAPQKGQKGDTGATGAIGAPGTPGQDGHNGIGLVAKTIPALITQCSNGGTVTLVAQDNQGTGIWDVLDIQQSSFVTCNGNNGINGSNGTNGTDGRDGSNGTQVNMVQFCSRYSGSYPGTFPEFGIVVDNKIFAVYWDGRNAWMAEVYPGYYASTSTSAPCNFTVNSDGSVSN